MGRICIVCKKETSPYDNTRSFHKFPDDQNLKKAWMAAIGVSSVGKCASICSDHFERNSFHQTDGYTHRKRLLPNALPSINICNGSNKYPCNINKYNQEVSKDNKEISVLVDWRNLKEENSQSTNIEYCHLDSPNSSTSKSRRSRLETDNIVYDDRGNGDMHGSSQSFCCETVQDAKPFEKKHEIKSSDQPINRKRKLPIKEKIPIRKKRIRFMYGYQTKYISRDQFVSDEAWNTFLMYHAVKTRQATASRQKNFRRNKKISSLKQLQNQLIEEKEFAASEYLQVIINCT